MNNPEVLQDCMKAIVTVVAPLKKQLKSNRRFVESLLHIFSGVTDFRQPLKVTYKLENILCICLLISMRGKFTSFHNASLFIKVRADYFKKLKLIEDDKIPSHDTLRRIFMSLDADELRNAVLNRIKALINKILNRTTDGSDTKVRLISGDGKTFNGSGRKNGKRNINVFNVLNASSSVCLTSIPLDDKDSEIKAFQNILQKLSLKNTMVTADALHCQRKTLEIITRKGGLYSVIVKDNQPSLREHIIDVLNSNKTKCISETYNMCDYEIFILDYETNEDDFPGSKAFVKMISHKRMGQADYNPESQYFITSADNKRLIIESIDNRWSIEGDYHWLKDDFLKEDECTFTNKNAIKVMATFNNITYALYRIASAIFDDNCMAETRLRYEECPEEMLAKLVPLLEKRNFTTLIKNNMRGRKKAEA